jgi:hypothetical protein
MVDELRIKGPNPMRKPWQVWQETVGGKSSIESKPKKERVK